MDAEEDDYDLATGDIVLARTGADDESEWTEVAVVIRPLDLGATSVRGPVVLTVHAVVGEFGRTLDGLDLGDLVVVPGEHESHDELIARLRGVIATSAEPSDEAAESLVAELRARFLPTTRGLTSRLPLDNILGRPGTIRVSGLSLRRCPFGDPLPCQHSLGGPR